MTLAIGTDILEIERLQNVLARQGEGLSKRILTAEELEKYRAISHDEVRLAFLAKRWCAKEAIAKALGTGIAKGIGWHNMVIENNSLGAPVVQLNGAALQRLEQMGASKVLISISDERHYAVAFCSIV